MRQLISLLFFLPMLTGNMAMAQSGNGDYRAGELYVRLNKSFPLTVEKPSITPPGQVLELMNGYREQFGIREVRSTFYFSGSEALRRTFRVYFSDTAAIENFIRELHKNPVIEYAERIPQDRFFFIPNDLGPNNTSDTGQWYLHKIRAIQAWAIRRGDSAIKVAVVDDAVQVNHPELVGVCLPGRDVANGSDDPSPPNTAYSHGTHVAGIIAANTDNGMGIASLAHGVKIIPVRVTLNGLPETPTAGYEGIVWATAAGADVISLSWGSGLVSQTAQTVVGNALSAGIVVVAAAGNEGTSSVNYPAGYPGVISVASTTGIDARAATSNFGSWIDVAAPGDRIYSLIPFDGYGLKNGTSFAAPLVAGLAALLLSADSSLTPGQVQSCIKSSCDNIDVFNPSYIGLLGTGRINAERALACVGAIGAAYEASIAGILNPPVAGCNTTLNPEVRIVNNGTQPIHRFGLTYRLNNGFPLSYEWEGLLNPFESLVVALPELQTPPGSHTLTVTLNNLLNGSETDAYTGNNQQVLHFQVLSPVGLPLPFTEDFESSSFKTKNWTVENPGSDFGWEIATTAGTSPGNKSARLTYYLDFQTGERDYLTTPTLNFSGYSAISFTFRHAYMQRTPGVSDTLIVSISTDCGENWIRLRTFVETGTRTFATLASSGSFFIPSATNNWCGSAGYAVCTSINLTPYAGSTGVRIRFEGYNNRGSNIYIDNISITGTLAPGIRPIAGFTAAGNDRVCQGGTVRFTNLSRNQPTGYKWYFPGGVPDSSLAFEPQISYPGAGLYPVTLIVSKASGTDTLTLEELVTVDSLPPIVATAVPDSVCRGAAARLIASGGIRYTWNSHSSLSSLTGDTVTATPQSATTYTVTGISSRGCTNTAQVRVGVFPQPPVPVITEEGPYLAAPPAAHYEWYHNGVLIADSDTQRWLPLHNGNYNVRITDENGCSVFSSPPYPVLTVGMPEAASDVLRIYPDPAHAFFIAECSRPIHKMELYNAAGQLMQSFNSGPFTMQPVDVSGLDPGIFILLVHTSERVIPARILVAR